MFLHNFRSQPINPLAVRVPALLGAGSSVGVFTRPAHHDLKHDFARLFLAR